MRKLSIPSSLHPRKIASYLLLASLPYMTKAQADISSTLQSTYPNNISTEQQETIYTIDKAFTYINQHYKTFQKPHQNILDIHTIHPKRSYHAKIHKNISEEKEEEMRIHTTNQIYDMIQHTPILQKTFRAFIEQNEYIAYPTHPGTKRIQIGEFALQHGRIFFENEEDQPLRKIEYTKEYTLPSNNILSQAADINLSKKPIPLHVMQLPDYLGANGIHCRYHKQHVAIIEKTTFSEHEPYVQNIIQLNEATHYALSDMFPHIKRKDTIQVNDISLPFLFVDEMISDANSGDFLHDESWHIKYTHIRDILGNYLMNLTLREINLEGQTQDALYPSCIPPHDAHRYAYSAYHILSTLHTIAPEKVKKLITSIHQQYQQQIYTPNNTDRSHKARNITNKIITQATTQFMDSLDDIDKHLYRNQEIIIIKKRLDAIAEAQKQKITKEQQQ